MTLRIFTLLTLLALAGCTSSRRSVRMGAGNTGSNNLPAFIDASDGDYEKFVLIRWDAQDKSTGYRLFRATSSTGSSMQELTKTWQKSNWFCDYSAEKGRDYFYAVMSQEGTTTSALSKFDKGFIRKANTGMAADDLTGSSTTDRYAAGKQVFLLISEVTTDAPSYAPGATVHLNIMVQNIFEESTPRTDFRIYLSSDTDWSFDDTLLMTKLYSGFSGKLKGAINEQFSLPTSIIAGNYYLIVAAAPESNILQSKTGVTTLNIQSK